MQLVALGQPGLGDHVAVGSLVPPAPVHSCRFGQGLVIDLLKLLEGEGGGTLGAGCKKAFELIVLPALGDGLFGAAVPRLFPCDAFQDGLHIVRA